MYNHIFTFFKKYRFVGLILLLLLTGCQLNSPIDANSTGFFNHYFIYPFSLLIKFFASMLGENYGWSIVLITLLIRLILMPFSLKQVKSSMKMKEKMNVMKPEMDAITEKYKDKRDANAQMEKQQEMTKLYQKHDMNPLTSFGCLPMVIQFPIIIAFYYSIRRTPEIAAHSFLWFNLGQVDFIIPFVAAAIYFLQSRVSLIGMEPKQRKQMAIMGLISPVMIGFISFTTPAALPLYWTVSGLFLVFQTLISKKLYQPNKQ
ncbi:YidC/Oxa1 family membrane protein insertase [Virgibacillus halotolerans]|uniref:membrane protein insertase YidC n=1 Tax=Virgibacillus halotolerans TaxID=1071053 RepID=UPI00195FD561|nr:membrane protein insertase YidC [Virgibacillus halotolerans]MBM7598657.1 YidC/Oxa1 family membrane protein insertase [Virgibacillus halotolerans]